MSAWENHVYAAIADLTAATTEPDGWIEAVLGHLHDAAANVNKAIEEAESEIEDY